MAPADDHPGPPPPAAARGVSSLRRDFGRLLLLAGLVPSLVIAAAVLWMQSLQERSQLGERIVISARLTAASVDDFLQGHVAGVGLLAAAAPRDDQQWQVALEEASRLYPAFSTMLVTDREGRIRLSRGGNPEPGLPPRRSVADRQYFREPAGTGEPYLSDAFRGRGLGTDALVAVAAPLHDQGDFAGVVEGSIKVDTFAGFLGEAMHSRGYELLLLDRSHRVIYASPGLDFRFLQHVAMPVLYGTAGSDRAWRVEHLMRDGSAALLAAAPMRSGWTLDVIVSEAALDAAVRRRALLVIGLMLLLSGVMLAISWWQMRLLTGSVNALVGQMRRFAFGSAPRSVDVAAMPVELRPLGEGLNHMASRLSEAYSGVTRSLEEQHRLRESLQRAVDVREQQVAERTDELRAAVAKLNKLNRTDPLTGCLNRRGLDEKLLSLRRQISESPAPLAVLALDIDHFKDYNDRYGHPAGDAALQRFVGAVRSALYGVDDVLARSGGEEFMVLLPGTGQEVAVEVAERMRMAVRNAGIPHAGGESGVLTVSIGVAVADQAETDPVGSALRRADQALYRAKREGRDRIAV